MKNKPARLRVITTTILTIVSVYAIQAAEIRPVYIIKGRSVEIVGDNRQSDKITGLLRLESQPEPGDAGLYDQKMTAYILKSVEKNYEIWFLHYRYNLKELAKRRPLTVWDSIPLYSSLFNPAHPKWQNATFIDVDEFLRTKTKEEAYEWVRSMVGRDFYIVDERFYDKVMKLDVYFDVEMSMMGIPDRPQPPMPQKIVEEYQRLMDLPVDSLLRMLGE